MSLIMQVLRNKGTGAKAQSFSPVILWNKGFKLLEGEKKTWCPKALVKTHDAGEGNKTKPYTLERGIKMPAGTRPTAESG